MEIKNYKGRISYPARYRTEHRWQRGILVPQQVVDGFDDSRLLQEKVGNYGEGIFTKEHRNPLKKTNSFIYDLKCYLSQLDARCKQLYIIPVVGFSELADISAIYDFEAGMIHTWQLLAFFARHGQSAAAPPPSWPRRVLNQIPTWDLIVTTRNEWINGSLWTRH